MKKYIVIIILVFCSIFLFGCASQEPLDESACPVKFSIRVDYIKFNFSFFLAESYEYVSNGIVISGYETPMYPITPLNLPCKEIFISTIGVNTVDIKSLSE